jgi:hypothetical protein
MTMPTPGERRHADRIATEFTGTLGDHMQCSVVNLSKTGALAIGSHALEEMHMVQIDVQVKNDDGEVSQFACEAAVVRCDARPDGAFDLGLYFTSMSDEARAILVRAVAQGSIAPVT